MAYQDARADQVPQFRDMRAYWDTDIILTGPTIVLGDYGTNLNDDYRTPSASRVIIDATQRWTAPATTTRKSK